MAEGSNGAGPAVAEAVSGFKPVPAKLAAADEVPVGRGLWLVGVLTGRRQAKRSARARENAGETIFGLWELRIEWSALRDPLVARVWEFGRDDEATKEFRELQAVEARGLARPVVKARVSVDSYGSLTVASIVCLGEDVVVPAAGADWSAGGEH